MVGGEEGVCLDSALARNRSLAARSLPSNSIGSSLSLSHSPIYMVDLLAKVLCDVLSVTLLRSSLAFGAVVGLRDLHALRSPVCTVYPLPFRTSSHRRRYPLMTCKHTSLPVVLSSLLTPILVRSVSRLHSSSPSHPTCSFTSHRLHSHGHYSTTVFERARCPRWSRCRR